MKNSNILPPDLSGLARCRLLAGLCILGLSLAACLPADPSGGGGDPFLHPPTKGPTPTLYSPAEIDLTGKLDPQGHALAPLVLEAPDGCLRLEIDQAVTVLDAAGQPASRLIIQQDYPGKLPMEAYGVTISYAYRFGPDELRFSAPAKVVFACLKNYKRTMVTEISLGMKSDDEQWQQLSVQGEADTIWTHLESVQPGWRYLLVGPAPMGS
jgi:hypothetical protein